MEPLIAHPRAVARPSTDLTIRTVAGDLLAGDVVDDLSFHRVWWRRHWVLWYDQPRTFEQARPWSHRVPTLVHALSAVLPAALWLITFLTGGPALGMAALAVAVVAAGYMALVALAEVRFALWVRGNDDRVFLEALLPPAKHHPDYLASNTAQRASRELALNGRAAVEEFAKAHAERLRGWRRHGTRGWVRLSKLTGGTDALMELVAAADNFRDVNESWGSEDDWNAAFAQSSLPERRPWSQMLRKETGGRESAEYEAVARAVLDSIRSLLTVAEARPGWAAVDRLYPRVVPVPAQTVSEETYRSDPAGANPFLVLGAISIGIVVAGFGILQVPAWVDAVQSGETRERVDGTWAVEGAHEDCLIEGVTPLDTGYLTLDTTCGLMDAPHTMAAEDLTRVGWTYDFEVGNQNRVTDATLVTDAGGQ